MKKRNSVLTVAVIAVALVLAVGVIACDNYVGNGPNSGGGALYVGNKLTGEQMNLQDFGVEQIPTAFQIDIDTAAKWADLPNKLRTSGNYIVKITADIVEVPGVSAPNLNKATKVSFRGDGSLQLAEKGSLLYIAGGQEVILRGPVFKGKTNNAPVVRTSGTLTMRGGEIRDNSGDTGVPSGVLVESGGRFVMYDGTIYNNTGCYGGGGVRVGNGGSFLMHGGFVSGNTAKMGGGVYIEKYGYFSLSKTGGAIYGDTDAAHFPGAKENTATRGIEYGPAVYYENGPRYRYRSLEEKDFLGTDSDEGWDFDPDFNGKPTTGELWVFNEGDPRLDENDGKNISWKQLGDRLNARGNWIVHIEEDITSVHNSNLGSADLVSFRGAGSLQMAATGSLLYIPPGKEAVLRGPALVGNADNTGALVVVSGGKFIMRDGSVKNNHAARGNTNGGGVNVEKGTFIMEGGTVSGNAAEKGGGVFVSDGSYFYKTGGTIYGDTDAVHTPGANENTAARGKYYGHAVYYSGGGGSYRNRDAGPDITLSTADLDRNWDRNWDIDFGYESVAGEITIYTAADWDALPTLLSAPGNWIVNIPGAVTGVAAAGSNQMGSATKVSFRGSGSVSLGGVGSLLMYIGPTVILRGPHFIGHAYNHSPLVQALGPFIMWSGAIRDNVIPSAGAGINAVFTFEMHGGTISGNMSTRWQGGGVTLGVGPFTKTGGVISGNRANNPDGGPIGHQVYFFNASAGYTYYRDADLGENDNLSTGNLTEAGGWSIYKW